ncbi:DUF771 domain-containing protein, partial [Aerococcus urinaeequi]
METASLINSLIEKEIELAIAEKEKKIRELEIASDKGSIGDMKWFCERTGMSANPAKERILYPFRKELEGKLVKYPESSGSKWQFNKFLVNQWITENFERW